VVNKIFEEENNLYSPPQKRQNYSNSISIFPLNREIAVPVRLTEVVPLQRFIVTEKKDSPKYLSKISIEKFG